jgi:ABC-type uncharacterized transport system ATPase subunit
VLRRGRVVRHLPTSEATEVLLGSLMVGREVAPQPGVVHTARSRSGVVLGVRDLVVEESERRVVDGITLSLGAGEIVGIAGVEGNGQLEFAEAIHGLRRPTTGCVELAGRDVTAWSTVQRRLAGLRYISPDRQREGLVLDFDVTENMLIGNARLMRRGMLLDRAAAQARADEVARSFRIKAYARNARMRDYSGGTQQKFLAGRESAKGAIALIAFAPTRGVDIGAARTIYEHFRELQTCGAGILLISYDLDEIRLLASRIIVFNKGRIAGELSAAQADDEALGRLMGGAAA